VLGLLSILMLRLRREEGATMVEYGLMVALIAIIAMAAVQVLGVSISDIFGTTADKLDSVQPGG
jgi:pilus assembly protein Flp/PilA